MNANYIWYPTDLYMKPMERQISEALKIKEGLSRQQKDTKYILMNGKTEFNRCILPGITPQVTTWETEEGEKITKLILRRKQLEKQRSTHPNLEPVDTAAAEPTVTQARNLETPEDPALETNSSTKHIGQATNPASKGVFGGPLRSDIVHNLRNLHILINVIPSRTAEPETPEKDLREEELEKDLLATGHLEEPEPVENSAPGTGPVEK